MCIDTFEYLSKAEASGISLVSVTAMQSPALARIASGSDFAGSASVAALSFASTKSLPFGSVNVGVRGIAFAIETMLYVRSLRLSGQRPSFRPAYGSVTEVLRWDAFAPRYGVPVWPEPVNGGRMPIVVRSSGYAGRPLRGLNRIVGRFSTTRPLSTSSRLG